MGSGEIMSFTALFLFFLCILPPLFHLIRCRTIKEPLLNDSQSFLPDVTILLPVRNESKVITKKLDEIISMEYDTSKLRILIVDSASEDQTGEIASDFLRSSKSEIPFDIITISELGKSIAVNRSLEEIDTDFFVMMDAESQSPNDTITKIINRFSNPDIGAVCGSQYLTKSNSEYAYRSRYNDIRRGESYLDSTPIFEGSICAFRMSSIGSSRIDPSVNADDSQLAILVRKNGFRAVMDTGVVFFDEQPFSRKRSVRRAQGLTRILANNWRLCFGHKKYSKIFRNALYFYSIFPWILTMSFSLTFASIILIFYQTPIGELNIYLFAPQSVYFFLMLSQPGRGLFMGATILMESHIRFLLGQRMHIWDPSSRPPIES